jgi:hypothetical protein
MIFCESLRSVAHNSRLKQGEVQKLGGGYIMPIYTKKSDRLTKSALPHIYFWQCLDYLVIFCI